MRKIPYIKHDIYWDFIEIKCGNEFFAAEGFLEIFIKLKIFYAYP